MDRAFAEPCLQVPLGLGVGGVVLPIQEHNDCRELIVRENEAAIAVMAVNEHAHGLERDVVSHSLRRGWGRRVICQVARHPGERGPTRPVQENFQAQQAISL
jgi:hypothetical protein